LSADATVDIRLAGKILGDMPTVGDGVAEEDDAVFSVCGCGEGCVGRAVTCEFAEVVHVKRRSGFLPEIEFLRAGELGLLGQG